MNLGLARAVNSSAIRLWQLRKAIEFYEKNRLDNVYNKESRDFYVFMLDALYAEVDDLELEIKNIMETENAKAPKNPFEGV